MRSAFFLVFVVGCASSPEVTSKAPTDFLSRAIASKDCVALDQAQRDFALLDDEARAIAEALLIRCHVRDSRDDAARALSAHNPARRAFVDVLIAARDSAPELEQLLWSWSATGSADVNALVKEPLIVAHAKEPWFVRTALSLWDVERRVGRAPALVPFVTAVAHAAGRRVVEGTALQYGQPGDLAVAQGEIMKATAEESERVFVEAAGIHSRWVTTDKEIYGEGERIEPTWGGYMIGPDQIVHREHRQEVFSTTGHYFRASLPAHAQGYRRFVVVG